MTKSDKDQIRNNEQTKVVLEVLDDPIIPSDIKVEFECYEIDLPATQELNFDEV